MILIGREIRGKHHLMEPVLQLITVEMVRNIEPFSIEKNKPDSNSVDSLKVL